MSALNRVGSTTTGAVIGIVLATAIHFCTAGSSGGQVFLLIVPIAAIIGFVSATNGNAKPSGMSEEERERLRLLGAQEQARRKEREQADCKRIQGLAKRSQQQSRKSLLGLTGGSLSLYESLPMQLTAAEADLDQAEVDFDDGAFGPFWSSIESATAHLGEFYEATRTIGENADKFVKILRSHTGSAPQFPIRPGSVGGMQAATTTDLRMRELCRRAECDIRFATIYEQRKTNQLLVAGFKNLSQVIDGVGTRILSLIKDLDRQISQMHSMLDESLQKVNSTLDSLVDIQQENLSVAKDTSVSLNNLNFSFDKESAQSAERIDRALMMLDNIQRGKKPPEGTLDRLFHYRSKGDTRTPHDVKADNQK